ncbi:hypothetical protein Q3G72_020695 [Acer saccharum]|nr:hypothetical protein Q3G72_020695 [Acer saccharum]
MSNQDPRGKGLVEHLVPKEVGFQYDKECQHCKEINNCGFASAAYDQIQRLESQVVIGSDGTQVEFREEIILSADKVSEPGPEVSFKLSPSDKLVGLEISSLENGLEVDSGMDSDVLQFEKEYAEMVTGKMVSSKAENVGEQSSSAGRSSSVRQTQ